APLDGDDLDPEWAGDITEAVNDHETDLASKASKPLFARKTADETVNNSAVLQDDNHLFVTGAAGQAYKVEAHLLYNSGATPDARVGWVIPAGASMVIGIVGYSLTSTLVSTGNFTELTVLQLGGDGTDLHYSIYGIITFGASGGTVKIEGA